MSDVLLADDEAPMLEMLSSVVRSLGHSVRAAHDGEEALRLARARRPDLVVVDYMMPGIDGLQVVARLRSDPATRDVPILMTTAGRLPRVDGVDRLLEKPFPLDTFEQAVVAALAGATPPVPAAPEPPPRLEGEELLDWTVHEIKSPLAVARMAIELTLRSSDTRFAEADARRLRGVVRQIDRMHRLVHALLDASSLAAGQLTVRVEEVDLAPLAKKVVDDWRDAWPERTFSFDAPDVPTWVNADPERVVQILDNLLSNAVKHAAASTNIDVVVEVGRGEAHLRVRDRGPGIDAAAAAGLFRRFHRLEGTRAPGHGLGLYIASTLARMQGGRLSVDSEPGRGAVFSFTLPVLPKA